MSPNLPSFAHLRHVMTQAQNNSFGVHVRHAGRLYRIDESLALFECNRGRHCADDMLAIFHGMFGHSGMFGNTSEYRHCIDILVFHKIFEVDVSFRFGVLLLENRSSIRSYPHGRNIRIGVSCQKNDDPNPPPTTPMRTFSILRGPGKVPGLPPKRSIVPAAKSSCRWYSLP